MMGLGRFGGIAGSFLIGELAARHLGFGAIFTVMALPAIIAAAALVVKHLASPGAVITSAPGSEAEALGHWVELSHVSSPRLDEWHRAAGPRILRREPNSSVEQALSCYRMLYQLERQLAR
jgi:hypothetical protein